MSCLPLVFLGFDYRMKIQEMMNRLFSYQDDLFEMSNIRKNESGLPVNIYVSSGGSVNRKHGPRIKVMYDTTDKFNPHATVSVLVKRDITTDDVVGYERLPSKILNPIREYINLNYAVLMSYWNDELSTIEMIQQLQPLKG